LLADGTVKCWGNGNGAQLGGYVGSSTQQPPVAVNGIAGAVQISSQQSHTCVVLTDNTIKCWGANYFGQLGDGTRTTTGTPVSVIGL
jgi:alpha-tubulin suppressor-like RCC1 family protein